MPGINHCLKRCDFWMARLALEQLVIPESKVHHTPSAQLFLFCEHRVGKVCINSKWKQAGWVKNVFFQDCFQEAEERIRNRKVCVCIINGANDWGVPAVEEPLPI